MKPSVLVLVASYLPGMKGGGPIRSIANLVDALADDIDFRIITSDRDLGDDMPYPSIAPNAWTEVGKTRVLYLSPDHLSVGSLAHILASERADCLYLNSFLSRKFSILPMLLCLAGRIRPTQLVLAPRGEFSPGALGIKPRRKQAFIEVAKRLPVYRNAVWHASSAYEERDIRNIFGDEIQVRVALPISVLGAAPVTPAAHCKAPGSLRMICLTRVAPKKNLLGALEMLRSVQGQVEFDIYGPAEDRGYWKRCAAAIDALPPNIRVRKYPAVDHEEVARLFSAYHLFYFPTLGENYGHVIYEAMAAGCPALISDRTPWRDLERSGAGWDLPLESPEKFSAAIERAAAMSNEEFQAASANARRFARNFTGGHETLARSRALFCPA